MCLLMMCVLILRKNDFSLAPNAVNGCHRCTATQEYSLIFQTAFANIPQVYGITGRFKRGEQKHIGADAGACTDAIFYESTFQSFHDHGRRSMKLRHSKIQMVVCFSVNPADLMIPSECGSFCRRPKSHLWIGEFRAQSYEGEAVNNSRNTRARRYWLGCWRTELRQRREPEVRGHANLFLTKYYIRHYLGLKRSMARPLIVTVL